MLTRTQQPWETFMQTSGIGSGWDSVGRRYVTLIRDTAASVSRGGGGQGEAVSRRVDYSAQT